MLRVLLIGIVLHFLLLGSVVAAGCNFVANRHLRVKTFQGLEQVVVLVVVEATSTEAI